MTRGAAVLCLSLADVESAVDLPAAIDIADALYREDAAGEAVPLPPRQLTTSKASLRVSGGALLKSGGLGARISVSGGAYALGLLFDAVSGEPRCVMAYPFSTLRTAGIMGLATRELAPKDASGLAMIGAGSNAPGYARAACLLRPIEQIRVFTRSPEHREGFARRMEAELGIEVHAVAGCREACAGADIVCVATSSPTPVIGADDLDEGTFLVSMGRPGEIDASVYLAAGEVVVSYKPASGAIPDDAGALHELDADGSIPWASSVHAIGGLLTGAPAPKTGPITVFRDVQAGYGDIALCLKVYEHCQRLGLGAEVALS